MKPFLTLLMVLVLLVGCDDPSSEQTTLPKQPEKRLRIGVVPRNSSAPWRALRKSASKTATLLEVNLLWEPPERDDDAGSQLRAVDLLVKEEVDAIAISPVDAERMSGTLTAASKRIPIVFLLSPHDLEAASAFIYTSATRTGQLAAAEMPKIVSANANVGLLRMPNPIAAQFECEEAFRVAIVEKGQVHLAAEVTTALDLAGMQQAARKLISGPPRLAGIFAASEQTSLATLNSLESTGWAGEIKLIGLGYQTQLLSGLESGNVSALVVDDMPKIGELAINAALTLARKQNLERLQPVEPLLLTKQNRNEPYILSILQPGQ